MRYFFTIYVITFFVITFFVTIFAYNFLGIIMDTPFVFGRIATADNFTDRKEETAQLVTQFKSLINTIIISPRRWGKSSLVEHASTIAMKENPSLRICQIDLFNVRSEAEFYKILAQSVIKATSSRWEDAVAEVRKFFSHLVPKISIGAEPGNEISLDFDFRDITQSPDEILDLAEKIAVEKNLKLVICIDEFQNISEFTDSDAFQKKLRTHWQRHQHVAYCLYGSKRHMMMEVFTNSSKPFYKFGNIMFLQKIKNTDLVDFFIKRFDETGKHISDDAAYRITELIDCHPYYAQQLAQLSWLRTTEICNVNTVEDAFQSLVDQMSLLFINLTESLTTQQLNYLKAILAGEKSITSTNVMKRYNISSATAAMRSKEALIKNDIIDVIGTEIKFQDPVYCHWMKKTYFNLPS